MAAVPLDIAAEVVGADPGRPAGHQVRGQVAGRDDAAAGCVGVALDARGPAGLSRGGAGGRGGRLGGARSRARGSPACIPHLLVPELREALESRPRPQARGRSTWRPQPGETEGFAPETHLEVLADHAPELHLDVVLADTAAVPTRRRCGVRRSRWVRSCVLADLAAGRRWPRHDPRRLAAAYRDVIVRRSRR